MWKKLGVTLIALLSTFSVVYAMNKDMFAAGSASPRALGNVTARIGDLQKGDRVYLYTSGYEMQLLLNNITGYNAKTWFSMSAKIDDTVSSIYNERGATDANGNACPWTKNPADTAKNNSYECTNLREKATNANIALDNRDKNLVKNRIIHEYGSYDNIQHPVTTCSVTVCHKYHQLYDEGNLSKLFILNESEYILAANILGGLNGGDLAFSSNYVLSSMRSTPSKIWGRINITGVAENVTLASAGNIRYSAYLDLNDVVFSASTGSGTSLAKVKPTTLKTPLYTSVGETMKIRFLDSALAATFNQIENKDKNKITKTVKDSTVYLDASANAGASSEGINTVSAFIYDTNGVLTYYIPLEAAKGVDKYELDTTDIPVGTYTIAIANEVYDNSKTSPSTSSAITSTQPLEIVEPHTITYASSPKNQATYEYDKNVESGDKIGSLTRSDGVAPIHYELVADGSDTTYQNFEIAGLDVNGDSSEPSLDVKVKASNAPNLVGATNSLKAGTYKFCIVSKDANGDPVTDVVGQNKVCTSLKVEKATPTIAFNTTTQKDFKIGDSSYTDSITTSNTDALANSDVTYSLSGGTSNVLTSSTNSSDPLKYDLSVANTYTGSSLPAPFTLQATVKETANYLQATTTVNRPIFVYKELSALTWQANKGNYSSSDVTTGKTIGDLLAKDGVGPFDYELTTIGDPGNATDGINNGLFTIANGTNVASGTKVNVNTSSNLSVGSYKIQFKVTDKGKGTTVYATAIINVSAQVQNKVYFTDTTGTNDITAQGITLKFNEPNVSLLAKGGSNSLPMEYYVAAQADQPNQIDPSLYLSVNQTSGLLTPIKVGTIKVYATRPGDSNYGSANSTFMDVTIEPAEQSIAFNIATNPNRVGKGNSIIEKATGTVTLTNTQGVGGITYSSSDPTIATIDSGGNVTGVSAGTVTITATLNDPSSSTYDSNYESQSCQKTITVYHAMTLNWTATTPNLKAESSTTGSSAGSVSAVSNSGNVTYRISTNTGISENADGGLFNITPSGSVQLKNPITAAALDAHGSNSYKIRVEAIDNNVTTFGTVFVDIIITIDDATNTPHFTDSNGNVTSSISEVYGENGNTFQLYSTTSNGISAAYQLDPSDTSGTISVNGLGQVSILKVGTGSAQLVASAGTGYDGTTLTLPVTITPGNQAISFVDTTTLNRQFVANSTFNESAELKETSANTPTLRTITYTSTTPSVCSIDAAGTIMMHTTGSCTVTAVNNDANWQPVTTTKTINLFTGMGVTFAQSNTPEAETASAQVGSPVGSLTVNGGSGNKTYVISTNNNPKNKDESFFTINRNSGVISLKKAVGASDIANSYDPVKQAYILYVQFETTDTLGNKVITDGEVNIKGAALNASFDRVVNGKITQTYSPNGTFTVQLLSNAGNGQEIYRLKVDPTMPTDVLQSVAPNGLITIDNANDRVANATPVMVQAIIPPSGGYEGETIEVEVEITKALQPNFGFQNPAIQMQTSSTLTPIIKGQLSTGTITLTSSNTSLVAVNGNDLQTNTTEGTTTVTVIDSGDRNYQSATGTTTVTVSSQPAYSFVIQVPSAIYGNTGLKATILSNGATGANQVQTWVSSDPTIADIDASGNITIYQAGQVDITCTQTSTGEPSASHTVTMVIKPKPITITINDKDKYVGEQVPVFDMTIPSGVLVGNDTISLPTFSCVESATTPVTSTTPAGSYPITGTYPTGTNPNYAITVTPGTLTVKQDASQASWYHLEGVTSGNTLDPTKWYNEDVKVVLDSAVETAGTYDEISLDQTLWDANAITVTQEDENSEDVYFRINASGILSTSQSTTIKIDKTKPIVKSITGTQTNKDALSTLINNLTFGAFFKPGTLISIKSEDILSTPNIKVSGLQEVSYNVYEIDRKTGIMNSTPLDTGTDIPDANGNIEVKLDDVGLYRVCAIAKDNAGNISSESCSDVNIKKIDVDIDNDGENEFQDPDIDGCPDINIPLQDEKGDIYKINVNRDGDGIPDLNIDSDGDGIAEINVDTDKDGKPDLNLVNLSKWEPTFCVTGQIDNEGKPIEYCTMKGIEPVINVDTDKDGIPNINIDTKGDFKPHYNIARPGEDKPYLNIGNVHTTWKPDQDYKNGTFLYDSIGYHRPLLNIDSDDDGKPDINIDTNMDGEPDLNIDRNGDMVPDINIDGDGDGEADYNLDPDENGNPTKNMITMDKWEPNTDGTKDGLAFDTMEIKRKDNLEDQGVTVEKPGGSFLPNYSIKVNNIKDTIDEGEKGKIEEFIKGDTEIKDILDVKLSDGTSVIQPDGKVKVRIPVSDEIINSGTVKVVLEQKDGTYKEVDVSIKDGFIEYETDFLGKVGIIADKAKTEDPIPDPDPDKPDVSIPDFKPNGSGGSTPDTSVKGGYTSGIGGAGTGDTSNSEIYIAGILLSTTILIVFASKRRKDKRIS